MDGGVPKMTDGEPVTDLTTQRFDNRTAQIAMASFGGLIVMLGVAGLATSPATATVYLLFGTFTVGRGVRSSSVTVDQSGVTTRSMARTRCYAFTELRGVEVAVGRTGLTGVGREYLVFRHADGQELPFKEFNCRPAKNSDARSVVQRAAACIIERRQACRPTE